MTLISNKQIANAIYLSSRDKFDSIFFKKVVEVLSRRRLMSKSEEILLQLEHIVNKEEGRIVATVESGRSISEQSKRELMKFLKKHYSAREIVWREVLDERLLGGWKIQVNDEVIDLSLKNKFNKLTAYLTNSTF